MSHGDTEGTEMTRNPKSKTLNAKQIPNPKSQRAGGFRFGISELEFGHCLEFRILDLGFLLTFSVSSVPLWLIPGF